MWLAYACGSAFFAGITAILAKVGIKKIDSNLATAIRTIVVLIFAWIMVRLTGSYTPIGSIGTRTLIYLTLSGNSDRGILALLFSGIAARRCK